jgi:ElaB/YqjD/DUF883 family membrane-anchored ribosome-binding protein
MGLKRKVQKLGRDLKDRRKLAKVKAAVKEKLKAAMAKIRQVEKKLKDPRTRERARAELAKLKAKVRQLKAKYRQAERKAVRYTQENPKKALAIAAGIGLLAGALLAVASRKK